MLRQVCTVYRKLRCNECKSYLVVLSHTIITFVYYIFTDLYYSIAKFADISLQSCSLRSGVYLN